MENGDKKPPVNVNFDEYLTNVFEVMLICPGYLDGSAGSFSQFQFHRRSI